MNEYATIVELLWTHAHKFVQVLLMYAVTPEFNSDLVTFNMPTDDSDLVSESRRERWSFICVTLDSQGLFGFFKQLRNTFVQNNISSRIEMDREE